MNTRSKFQSRSGEVTDDYGEGEGGIFYRDQRDILWPAGDSTRDDDGGGICFEKLLMIFLVTEERHVARSGGVERGHSS